MGESIPENHYNVKQILDAVGLTDSDSGLTETDVINMKLSSDLKAGIY